ncbi:MAG: ABC transporter permease, partial [Brevibacterium yomogidense]
MIRIALSNLRSASGRLVAAGIAVAVSVAFMVAALLFAQGFGDTLANQVRSSWAGADVAVLADEREDPADAADVLTDDLLDEVAAVDGVESAHIEETGYLMASAGTSSVSAAVTGLPTNGQDPVDGTLPAAADELALNETDAEALGVAVGDTVTLEAYAATPGTEETDYTVSGLLPGSSSLQLTLHLTDDGLEGAPAEIIPAAIRVSAEDGTDPATLSTAIDEAIGERESGS